MFFSVPKLAKMALLPSRTPRSTKKRPRRHRSIAGAGASAKILMHVEKVKQDSSTYLEVPEVSCPSFARKGLGGAAEKAEGVNRSA